MTLLLAMISFSLVMSITPGPVNMIILSSGINYGSRKTMPYVSGATIGFTLLLLFIGLGFSKFISMYPSLLSYLTVAGSLYIIRMGYKLAVSKYTLEINKNNIPRFYEGFLLQWVNPKAWIACVSGATLFASVESYRPFMTFAAVYFVICYVSLGAWAVAGDKISLMLNSETRLRVFNLLMGVLLMATAGYLCWEV